MSDVLHPELEAGVRSAFEQRPTMGRLAVGDVAARREALARALAAAPPARVPGVSVEQAATVAPDGAEVPLRIYRAEGIRRDAAFLYIHGGGMIAGSLDTGEPRAMAIAAATGLTVATVGYRLAPEHPYPTPMLDCYSALEWLAGEAPRRGIDRTRIGIGGDSAGGGLAAGVALMARDREGPGIAALYLGCPMLDPRTIQEPPGGTQWYTWSHLDNETGWRAYLADLAGMENAPAYAAPAFAPDLSGLPPTYIDVGGLDLFRDEDIHFAARLWQAGVPCELHVIPGAPHGFTNFAPGAPVVKRIEESRFSFLASF